MFKIFMVTNKGCLVGRLFISVIAREGLLVVNEMCGYSETFVCSQHNSHSIRRVMRPYNVMAAVICKYHF